MFCRDGAGEEDRLTAGPVWDLDNALGAVKGYRYIGNLSSARGAYITEINEEYRTSVLKTLGKHEDFMEEVRRQ